LGGGRGVGGEASDAGLLALRLRWAVRLSLSLAMRQLLGEGTVLLLLVLPMLLWQGLPMLAAWRTRSLLLLLVVVGLCEGLLPLDLREECLLA
ncbi:MAG: hypothetical protein ACT6T3_21915, partial [Agrobacterium sp.]|uniref:hypothetical protein n=1 Tax=Agrobacterium sp. TaxID=361 RepID=UPI0040338EE3